MKEAREAAKKQKKRNVSAVAGNQAKEGKEEDVSDHDGEEAQEVASNGNSFGSGAYQQKKRLRWQSKEN